MSRLYEGVANYVDSVSWDDWSYAASVPWESHISGDIDFDAARGDGDQVLAMLHGLSTNPAITVSNLNPGNYDVHLFDFITGELVHTYANQSAAAGSFSLTLDLTNTNLDLAGDGYDRKRTGILLIEME